MKILEYLKKIKNRITELNNKTTNPFEYGNDNFPFFKQKAMTYVWIEDERKN